MINWHIITCEYPPQVGGVSDYTRLLAAKLRDALDQVQVWAPGFDCAEQASVHRVLGSFAAGDLRRTGEVLDKYPTPRTLLLQWVPHGYGKRGMNLGFTRWIASRVHSGDRLYLMVHEPYLERTQATWKLRFISAVQRRMMRMLLRSAARVFVSIPAWENYLRDYAPAALHCEWLPIPATIEANSEPRETLAIRQSFGEGAQVLGHLGTYSTELCRILEPALIRVLRDGPSVHVLLLGAHSDVFAAQLKTAAPDLSSRIRGAGLLPDSDLANHISACDLALQPFPDGLSSRRTSLMNVISRGVPVVSNIGHLTEPLWSDSQAVALAPTADPGLLADLCSQLLCGETARRQLAEKGRGLYQGRFDWENIVATLRSPDERRSATESTSSNRSGLAAKLE